MDLGTGAQRSRGCLQARRSHPRKPSQTGPAASLPFKDWLRPPGPREPPGSCVLLPPLGPRWAGGGGGGGGKAGLGGWPCWAFWVGAGRRPVCVLPPDSQEVGALSWTCPAVTGQKRGWVVGMSGLDSRVHRSCPPVGGHLLCEDQLCLGFLPLPHLAVAVGTGMGPPACRGVCHPPSRHPVLPSFHFRKLSVFLLLFFVFFLRHPRIWVEGVCPILQMGKTEAWRR